MLSVVLTLDKGKQKEKQGKAMWWQSAVLPYSTNSVSAVLNAWLSAKKLPTFVIIVYCVRKKMVAKVRNESIVDTNLIIIFSTFFCHSHNLGPI